jgi:serine protease Do
MSKQQSIQRPCALTARRTLIAGAVALALAAGGVALAQIQSPQSASAPPQAAAAPVAVQAPGAMPSFADVAERVTPAVVNVTTVSSATPQVLPRAQQGIPQDGPMGELFKRFFEQPGLSMPQRLQAAGSGFVIDPEGYIVTNHHVVDGASEVTITLSDGTKLKARVLGRDDKTDLALLKVDAGRPLTHVELGDSAGTRVGDWVLAVGNPFGLGGSVNAGIVSARGRDINSGPYDDYIQIDAPINRGHSGGPLFDAYGRVIGVNTAIYSPSGGNVGIGFAIPAETVRSVIGDLRAHGRVERGWLGVQIQPVTDQLAAGLGLSDTQGVLIADVLPDGPAAGSELRAGDVILAANEQPIREYKDLPKVVAATKAGAPMRLEVVRAGKPLSMTVTIGRMPTDEPLAEAETAPAGEPAQARLGLYLAPVTPDLRQEQGLGAESAGVFVARVEPGSPAEQAGIEAGSLISMVGGEPVSSPEQVVAAVRQAAEEKRPAVLLRIEKDGKPLYIAVPFSA